MPGMKLRCLSLVLFSTLFAACTDGNAPDPRPMPTAVGKADRWQHCRYDWQCDQEQRCQVLQGVGGGAVCISREIGDACDTTDDCRSDLVCEPEYEDGSGSCVGTIGTPCDHDGECRPDLVCEPEYEDGSGSCVAAESRD